MVFLLKKDILNYKMKKILSYVPSAIFPAIIFPPIFLDNSGSLDLENNPKILAAIFAILVGYLSKNIIATIVAGLTSYWFFNICCIRLHEKIFFIYFFHLYI